MVRFEFCKPSASRVEQKKYAYPDQVDDGKTESPPGWKRAEGRKEGGDILMHGEDKNNDKTMDDIQVKKIEEQGYAPKDN